MWKPPSAPPQECNRPTSILWATVPQSNTIPPPPPPTNWLKPFPPPAMTRSFPLPIPPADTPTTGPESKAIVTLAAGAAAMLLAMPLDAEMGPLDHTLMRLLPWLYSLPPDLLRWILLILTALLMAWAGRGIY